MILLTQTHGLISKFLLTIQIIHINMKQHIVMIILKEREQYAKLKSNFKLEGDSLEIQRELSNKIQILSQWTRHSIHYQCQK